ncbi:MAG TPA: S-methyl-5-thioribose-1-phosphate isomerase [Clostridia bacterium]|nr:S-methyl-5-thioribose-1-phosphate isomerase [Clostridia bacterium]
MSTIKTIEFNSGVLYLLDQRKLPLSCELFPCKTYLDVDFAIRDMVVRGAPAIGEAAAYGAVLAAGEFIHESKAVFCRRMEEALELLNRSRPTAVNLMWAVERMRKVLKNCGSIDNAAVYASVKAEADSIAAEDISTSSAMARYGNGLIKEGAAILTHCNTGALATSGYGTALGVIREAHYSGKDIFVYADETRPRLQGARLTAWELRQEGIPAKLIADSVAATLIRDKKIDIILVGADRIALNGDTANKIGTFMLSVVAKVYDVPFYVVAPTSTIDFSIESGKQINIEERSPEEVTHIEGTRIAAEGIDIYNPAFDVTPNENIAGIITEKGILYAPYEDSIYKIK